MIAVNGAAEASDVGFAVSNAASSFDSGVDGLAAI